MEKEFEVIEPEQLGILTHVQTGNLLSAAAGPSGSIPYLSL